MRQPSVDDRLEQLVSLFNTRVLGEGPGLQYTRQRVPVSGKHVCNVVHPDPHHVRHFLFVLLEERLSWEDNARATEGDVMSFVDFLQGTFVWSRVRGGDIAVPDG